MRCLKTFGERIAAGDPDRQTQKLSRFNVVPEVGLEPTSLAAGDFESPASTVPPLGPAPSLTRPRRFGQRQTRLQSRAAAKVSQVAMLPDLYPS
jgi:hypothetical protein